MSFRENLREAIDYSGLEQKELAYKANISLRNIENYLRENASIPSADKAVQIAQALGVTVEYLVNGVNMPKEVSAPMEPKIDYEIRQLIRTINCLPAHKQRAVIKNALSLTGIIKEL
ncbi:MAG: helix-turn-helix domain-containing protein [Treponema sp.]|jgi:transcriptional regulator with XRE-family HTH domain|nr:helix-turn-helix domain-containing protein [Treponema sp.]